MRIKNFFLLAIFFFMAEAAFAIPVSTQAVVNVISFTKGSTTLKFTGKLSYAALDAIDTGKGVAIINNYKDYLVPPIVLPKTSKGFGNKTDLQNVSIGSSNKKFIWTEKDVTENFRFKAGDITIKPTQATLKSSGTLSEVNDDFGSQKVTLYDILDSEKGLNCLASCVIFPENSNGNFKYSKKEADCQVKFSANSNGKVSATFKLMPNAVSPALIDEYYTNYTYMVVDLTGGTNAASFAISYLDDIPEGGWTEEYKTTKMVFRYIRAGKYIMGSPKNELGRDDYSYWHYYREYYGTNDWWDNYVEVKGGEWETQREVTLTKPFFIGVFEVTQRQFELIAGYNPSQRPGADRPVDYVSFWRIRGPEMGLDWPENNNVDTNSFLWFLREKTGAKFDLPTEAQWEYACRACSTTSLNSGNNIYNVNIDGYLNQLGRYAYNYEDRHGGYNDGHTTVGSYLPNAWGLYDMHGNVREWCLDRFDPYEDLPWTSAPVIDPVGSTNEYSRWCRARRGGGSNAEAFECRSAYRGCRGTSIRGPHGGFRLVLVP